jgi:DNA (cytosine-5)-methyltransferase 1
MAAAEPRGGHVTVTIGSLCTGYRGLDTAVEHVTGGRTVWHCEIEDAPSRLLAHRFPDVPNHRDLKTLAWAEHPVDVLTGGYPCQPFSGAGLRKGTDDPRHLFPWIARGIELMRPPLVLLENVRSHLSLGFDVVLAQFDRLGYDVRWMLLPASVVGAPHRRSRLWIAARAREAGGWPTPPAEPVARLDSGVWVEPSDGLFGAHPLPLNDKGSVPLWPTGTLVDGRAWQHETVLLGSTVWAPILMPTPRRTDSNGAAQHGDGGLDLRTAVSSPPTPKARDHKGCDPNPRGVDLNQAVHDAFLPTPRATDGTKGGPNQRGSSGDLMLPSAIQLLPTPAATDGRGARNSTSGRQEGSQHHSGDTLGDLVHDGRLLPTPTTDPDSWNGHARDLGSEARLLSTPVAADGGGARASSAGWVLRDQSRTIAAAWGRYAVAVARWEALTRPAPAPTQPGRSGPRLSPAFVEWMQGLPAGWVTDVPGLTRNHMLTMLGNGVVPQCAAAAYTLLGITPDLFAEVAA